MANKKKEIVSKTNNENNNRLNTNDDEQNTSDEVRKTIVDVKKTIKTEESPSKNKEMSVDVKPPKRSPDNEDITMAPPAKVSRLLESPSNEKKVLCLKIENIPGTYEETRKIIKQYLETEFGVDSELELKKEQTDEKTNIIIKVQHEEDIDGVLEKLNEFKIDGKSLSVVKHYEDRKKVVPVDLFDEDYEGTYGLSEDFLKELGIKPPLTKWIHISNMNCQRNILMELMEFAGRVLYCNVTHAKMPYAKVMFSHPLEAVQAVSLFNKQTFYGRLLNVDMVQPPPNEGIIPKGVQKIGKGLGRDGTPLRDVIMQFERYYKGQKSYIDNSVLESEKDKAPVAKKVSVVEVSSEKEKTIDEKKNEKKEEIKEAKKEEKKEVAPKKFNSVMTQTHSLPSFLVQKISETIKKGVSVSKISKTLDRLCNEDDDVIIVSNDKDKNKSEKGKGKRERPRSVSPVAAKQVNKPEKRIPVRGPATPLRPPATPIRPPATPIRPPATPLRPPKPFNEPSNSQQQMNNFSPNNSFNNQSFNPGANNMGGYDGNCNQNIGMMHNMGPNMGMGQQNIPMGQQNIGMGQQNMSMGQQNIPIMPQNMPMAPQNMPMNQQNMAMGQHNMGQNNMNPFNSMNQVVSMAQNSAGNFPIGQTGGQMALGQMGQGGQPMGQSGPMGQVGQSGPMGQVGQTGPMGQSGSMVQGGAMGQSGFQNQQVILGQADFMVLVNNLPQSVTFELLREKMSSCGDVKFLKMTNPGCAVVGYGELWEAQRCVAAFNKTVVDGHKVELRMM